MVTTSYFAKNQRGVTTPAWIPFWIGLGSLLGILLIVLFFAPARWLSHYVTEATDHRLELMDASGSLWNGSVQLKLGAGKGARDEAVLPGRVFWKIRPGMQGLRMAISADCCLTQPWDWLVKFSFNGIRIDISDLPESQPSILPSALLAGLGTPWNTLQLQGALSLSTRKMSLLSGTDGWGMAGQVQMDATDISTSLSTLKPIGSYRFILHGGTQPYLQLSTLEGSLKLSGSGRWVNHKLQFQGEASAQPEHADALANLLNIIGRRDGQRVIIQIG